MIGRKSEIAEEDLGLGGVDGYADAVLVGLKGGAREGRRRGRVAGRHAAAAQLADVAQVAVAERVLGQDHFGLVDEAVAVDLHTRPGDRVLGQWRRRIGGRLDSQRVERHERYGVVGADGELRGGGSGGGGLLLGRRVRHGEHGEHGLVVDEVRLVEIVHVASGGRDAVHQLLRVLLLQRGALVVVAGRRRRRRRQHVLELDLTLDRLAGEEDRRAAAAQNHGL